MTTPLISADDLAAALAGGHPPIVLDVRWSLVGGTDRAAYDGGHIPGAVFVDFKRDLCGPAGPGGRHPLPEPDDLQAALRRAGIDDGDEIVVVDDGDLLPAARTWWTLRWAGVSSVRVLDGGMSAWPGAVTKEAVTPEAGHVTVRPGSLPALDAEGAAARARAGQLVDVRAAERYRGETETIDAVAGHVPGALSVPDPVISGGRLIPPDAVRALLAGIDHPAAYCGSGITAARMALAGATAGIDVDLYVGSWSGWITDPARPIATGPHPSAQEQ
jgi:thiosulfate/3-mercaptopyruvate sulfurtransferase